MKTLTWTIGNTKITNLVEIDKAGDIIQEVIPQATPQNIKDITWLQPHFADSDGILKAFVQSFIIKTPEKTILVDTCNGNEKSRTDMPAWGNLQTDFLERLSALGYDRNDIDVVLCTHLHFDHVGWNTMLVDGQWVPTFPNARYLMAREEFEYWQRQPEAEIDDDRAGFADSVLPVYEAGLVDLVETNHQICAEVALLPTPGHTPAHVSVVIQSEGQQAAITGDCIHHPCQIAQPKWETIVDTNAAKAVESREKFLAQFVDTGTTVLGSHFAGPVGGEVITKDDTYVLKT